MSEVHTTNIHASCVVLARAGEAFGALPDAGVLLLGESGAGKSDLALRLIERGAVLVADDRVELFARDNVLMARAPKRLAGLIEARGVGVFALPHLAEARVALAVLLQPPETIARLPERDTYAPPLSTSCAKPPLLRLSAFEASTPAKIVAAAAALAHSLFREDMTPD